MTTATTMRICTKPPIDVPVTIPNSHKTNRITAIVYNIIFIIVRDLWIIRALTASRSVKITIDKSPDRYQVIYLSITNPLLH